MQYRCQHAEELCEMAGVCVTNFERNIHHALFVEEVFGLDAEKAKLLSAAKRQYPGDQETIQTDHCQDNRLSLTLSGGEGYKSLSEHLTRRPDVMITCFMSGWSPLLAPDHQILRRHCLC